MASKVKEAAEDNETEREGGADSPLLDLSDDAVKPTDYPKLSNGIIFCKVLC